MKITDHVFHGTEFRRLRPGATFKKNDEYFIKIRPVKEDDDVYNAVELTNGGLALMSSDDTVYPFLSEIVVSWEV